MHKLPLPTLNSEEPVLRTNFAKFDELEVSGEKTKGDYFERLENLMRQYFYFLANNPNFVRLLAWEILLADKSSLKRLARQAFGGISTLRNVLEEGIERGILRQDIRLHTLSLSITSLFFNFFNMRPLAEEFWNRDLKNEEAMNKILQQTMSLLLDGAIQRK